MVFSLLAKQYILIDLNLVCVSYSFIVGLILENPYLCKMYSIEEVEIPALKVRTSTNFL